MKLIDIHTHTYNNSADIIVVRNLSLSEAEKTNVFDNDIFFSVGIHPWDIAKTENNLQNRLEKVCRNDSVVLIGECGLDKNIEVSEEIQVAIFKQHVELSEMLKKPLIIHCVGYFNELIALKKQLEPEQYWIVHGFRGKPQLAEQIIKAGFFISFGEKYNPLSVRITPINRILIETDESKKSVGLIYQEIAKIKICSLEELVQTPISILQEQVIF